MQLCNLNWLSKSRPLCAKITLMHEFYRSLHGAEAKKLKTMINLEKNLRFINARPIQWSSFIWQEGPFKGLQLRNYFRKSFPLLRQRLLV